MFELLGHGLLTVLEWKYLLPLFAGTLVGVIGGALPGVTITMTIIVVLPFTYGLDPLQGLATMTGVYVGGSAGGLVTACLLGIPGTPSAIATTFDGFPMARGGAPGRALWLGIWSSFFGGLLGGLFLILVTGPLAAIALEFGPWEYFSLFVLAMAMVAGLAGSSFVKGLLSTAIGLLITVIGTDPIGSVPRFTFGSEFISGGFPFLPVLIGIFAFAQIMSDIEKVGVPKTPGAVLGAQPSLAVSHLKVIGEILGRPFLLLWSTIIGILIGALPAIGGSAANMLAYDQAKKFSRHPERFGTGVPEGIIASESSNNANVGGSLVTIMAFGIPGDAVTAVMLGAMTIHGIQSGPLFVSQQPGLAYGIYAAYILAHALMVLILAAGTLFVLQITRVRLAVLAPVVLVLCVIGAYALNNTMQSVYVLLIFGVFGYALVKAGFPLAPLILGLILGDQIEINLIRAIMTDDSLLLFFTRPISGGLLFCAALSVGLAVWQHVRHQRRTPREEAHDF
ncbi:tripartite tricarboxylate transporter permease [Bradyrhizobium cenepequi]|uniref:tripartite tricarboxylate transporter permease n=1 Tax=Bradyrhizobium cenepequi TaxID=2821403 RepID=UPI001CE29204|nr:tripartite tricarboxylate transporter permease [Bradyrhizobium cenepequi]MCA6110285.1 tripartite tricarboxylate transporter permease [Bradyrhizobium cenepequi]